MHLPGRLLHHRLQRGPALGRLRPRAAASTSAAAGEEFFAGGDKRGVILYDGVCNMCNGAVQFALQHDKTRALRFASLQSAAGRALLRRSGRSPDDISSIVLVTERESFIKSEAVLEIGKFLELPLHQLSAFGQLVPQALRDFAYDQVANNRYSFLGRTAECQAAPAADPGRFLS